MRLQQMWRLTSRWPTVRSVLAAVVAKEASVALADSAMEALLVAMGGTVERVVLTGVDLVCTAVLQVGMQAMAEQAGLGDSVPAAARVVMEVSAVLAQHSLQFLIHSQRHQGLQQHS